MSSLDTVTNYNELQIVALRCIGGPWTVFTWENNHLVQKKRHTPANLDWRVTTLELGPGKKVDRSEADNTSPSLQPVGTFHVILPPGACSKLDNTTQAHLNIIYMQTLTRKSDAKIKLLFLQTWS